MKKTAILAAVVIICFNFAAAGWSAGALYNGYPVVNLAINGKPVTSEVPAITMDGRTLVPLRFLIEELGYQVEYDSATSTVDIQLGNSSSIVSLTGNEKQKTVYYNDTPFCTAYLLPETSKNYAVSIEDVEKYARNISLSITKTSRALIFSDGQSEVSAYYSAKLGNDLYVDAGIFSTLDAKFGGFKRNIGIKDLFK